MSNASPQGLVIRSLELGISLVIRFMIHRQSGLGRGLGALIPPRPSAPSAPVSGTPAASLPATTVPAPGGETALQSGYLQIPVADIVPNPHQPRQHFEAGALEDLVASIKEHGVLSPLIVTARTDGTYELVAGERRLRAATLAGLATVPAVVRTASEQEKLELAIIENVQRQDLNPVEEALAYRRLMDEFGLTQDQVSAKVGKSRPQVANMVRLLQLPEEIQHALVERKISASNARTLLSLPSEEARMDLFRAMLAGTFTVRQTEARVPHPRRAAKAAKNPNLAEAERSLRDALGHRVEIKQSGNGSGEIRVGFEDQEDFQSLVKAMTGK